MKGDRDVSNSTHWHYGAANWRTLLCSDAMLFNSAAHLAQFAKALPAMINQHCPRDTVHWCVHRRPRRPHRVLCPATFGGSFGPHRQDLQNWVPANAHDWLLGTQGRKGGMCASPIRQRSRCAPPRRAVSAMVHRCCCKRHVPRATRAARRQLARARDLLKERCAVLNYAIDLRSLLPTSASNDNTHTSRIAPARLRARLHASCFLSLATSTMGGRRRGRGAVKRTTLTLLLSAALISWAASFTP